MVSWDWDPTSSSTIANDGSYHNLLQWRFQNAIGPNFCRQRSEAWQERHQNRDANNYSPWPGGVMTPPLALQVGLQKLEKPVDRLV